MAAVRDGSTLVERPDVARGATVDTAIFDADSHLMETPDWLGEFADEALRRRLEPLGLAGAGSGAAELMEKLPDVWESHRDQEIGPEVLQGPKGWMAPGALDTEVRSRVLDALGIDAQLVFPTFALGPFLAWTATSTSSTAGPRRSTGRWSPSARPTRGSRRSGSSPSTTPNGRERRSSARSPTACPPSGCPPTLPGDFSPTHVDLDPVWARLAEARVPFVLHVGGGKLLPKAFHRNGLTRPKDWLGGGENLRAKDFPVLHHSPERFLACMALDGVFERHPDLRGAAIELGATWVPGLLRNVDHAHHNFSKFEPALQDAQPQAVRIPAAPGAVHAVPVRGHRLAHRAVRARASSCSRPTTHTLKAAGGRSRPSATPSSVSTSPRGSASSGATARSCSGWFEWSGCDHDPHVLAHDQADGRRPGRHASPGSTSRR